MLEATAGLFAPANMVGLGLCSRGGRTDGDDGREKQGTCTVGHVDVFKKRPLAGCCPLS
jgi:hypothetical protein